MNHKKVKVYANQKGLKVIVNHQMRNQNDKQMIESDETVETSLSSELKQIWQNLFQPRLGQEQQGIGWNSPRQPFFKHKKVKIPQPVIRLLASISGAVIVGLIMGGALLQLFFSDPSTRLSSIDSHLPKPSPSVSNSSTATESYSLPALHVVMLQAGNFQDKQGAKEKLTAYRTQGIMAVMSERAPYRIFLGVGFSNDEALKLSTMYGKKEVDVYLKEWKVGGEVFSEPQAKKWIQTELVSALKAGNQLVKQLGNISVQKMKPHLKQEDVFALNTETFAEYQKWVTQVQLLESKVPPAAKEALSEMIRGLDQAIQSGGAAEKNLSQALLWQIQEGLVRYIIGYDRLIHVLKSSGIQ
ncbi:hypothetical protein [Thermoflavimicrobium dichotomicum]|uniref:Sporulation related domain-containing protein n=1 Tax=Thermoflavimicrobium dichotomicum TaxID=46223 RepID=A0A1I3R989_9BACL|nr:hypothetical protein [Thermoflavimicrobium dichotomicum]SFJ41951.1 hypothetical protein SAMN05421852_10946 [Thermoflavimicrobium dichotomicum]